MAPITQTFMNKIDGGPEPGLPFSLIGRPVIARSLGLSFDVLPLAPSV